MTDNMRAVLARLREVHEREDTDAQGIVWGAVYLDNVGQDRHFAGTLRALQKAGLYKPDSGGEFRDVWGYVKLQ